MLGRFVSPTSVTPSRSTISPGSVSSQLPPRLGGEVDDHRARPHRLDGGGRDDLRRRPAGNRSGRDHDVEVRDPLLERLLLRLHLLRRQLARVAALGLGAGHAEVEPVRAEALDLLAHDGTDVEAGRHGAEPARRRDRLQPGDAGADHEHLRGRDGARGGHQHREEARQMLRREERRLVAADRRLRRERVHRLRARDARDRLHRERRHAARRERLDAGRSESGSRKPMSTCPERSFASSSADGLRTLTTAVGLPRIAEPEGLDVGDELVDRLLRVAEQHHGLRVVEERVLDPGEARVHRALEHHDGLRVVDVEDRHAVDRRALVRARVGVDDVVRADDDARRPCARTRGSPRPSPSAADRGRSPRRAGRSCAPACGRRPDGWRTRPRRPSPRAGRRAGGRRAAPARPRGRSPARRRPCARTRA